MRVARLLRREQWPLGRRRGGFRVYLGTVAAPLVGKVAILGEVLCRFLNTQPQAKGLSFSRRADLSGSALSLTAKGRAGFSFWHPDYRWVAISASAVERQSDNSMTQSSGAIQFFGVDGTPNWQAKLLWEAAWYGTSCQYRVVVSSPTITSMRPHHATSTYCSQLTIAVKLETGISRFTKPPAPASASIVKFCPWSETKEFRLSGCTCFFLQSLVIDQGTPSPLYL